MLVVHLTLSFAQVDDLHGSSLSVGSHEEIINVNDTVVRRL